MGDTGDHRNCGALGRFEGPVPSPRGSLRNPSAQEGYLLGLEGLAGFGRRHDLVRIAAEDAPQNFALVGASSVDGDLAAFTRAARPREGVQSQASLAGFFIGAVASEARIGEQRQDFPGEANRCRG